VVSLTPEQVERFITDGLVKLENAFPRETANACADIIWRGLGLQPDPAGPWSQPVMRLTAPAAAPFQEAAASPRLAGALDQLVGAGRWTMPGQLGAIVARFPCAEKPNDDGWHLDGSFPPPDDPNSMDYFQWRVNYVSRWRSMLMLFLFTDCGPDDAPTRVRVASHLPMARQLKRHGEAGISLIDLAHEGFASSDTCDVALATGEAGTVWLLHPFTVHAAQAHHGTRPRFIAQPGLGFREQLSLARADGAYSPVEEAVRRALA
jgi:hypothetical protein